MEPMKCPYHPGETMYRVGRGAWDCNECQMYRVNHEAGDCMPGCPGCLGSYADSGRTSPGIRTMGWMSAE
jgi:ribosomal protein L37AE/L43A